MNPFRERRIHPNVLKSMIARYRLMPKLKADQQLALDVMTMNRPAAFMRAVRRALPFDQRVSFTHELFFAYRAGSRAFGSSRAA